MKSSPAQRRILQFIKHCWTVLIVVALVIYLWKNGSHTLETVKQIPLWTLMVAWGCILVGKLAAYYLMVTSLTQLNTSVGDWRNLLWIYSSTDVAKYMPGGIWSIVGRIIHYRNEGLDTNQISKALLLENVGFIATAALYGLPVGALLFSSHLSDWVWLGVASVSCGILLITVFIWRSERVRGLMIASYKLWPGLVAMTLAWTFMGTSFYLLLRVPYSFANWGWTTGSYAAAFAGGMLAVFAPAGAGIREGILVLAGHVQGTTALITVDAALLSRALWVVADITVFLIALSLRRQHK